MNRLTLKISICTTNIKYQLTILILNMNKRISMGTIKIL